MEEKNTGIKKEDLSSQESKQNEVKPKKLNESSADESLKKNQDLMRLTSLTLIDAAMGYREMFWREDVEAQLDILIENAKITDRDNAATRKRVMDKVKGLNLNFKNKQENLNKTCYAIIEDYTKHFNESQSRAFENMRVAFGLMAEEIINSKDRTELLTITRLYNQGKLDFIFEHIKNQENEKDNHPNANGADDSINTVQEERPEHSAGNNIDNNNSGHSQASMENGHQQSGNVQDGVVINLHGDKHVGGTDPQV